MTGLGQVDIVAVAKCVWETPPRVGVPPEEGDSAGLPGRQGEGRTWTGATALKCWEEGHEGRP